MSKPDHTSRKYIPQWQLDKIEMIFVDRWQETWKIVEQRDFVRKEAQGDVTPYPIQVSL